MKKAITALLCAGLLLIAAAPAWASNECYTLAGGAFFGGDMTLILTIGASSDGGEVLTVTGKGVDPAHDPIFLHGAAKTSAHVKEFSLHGSGPHIYSGLGGSSHFVSVIYEYHLTLGLGDGGWTGNYAGEIHTSEGDEKNVSGAATEVSCP
jgi:hypothetical protein